MTKIVGWVLSGLIFAMLAFSASMKLLPQTGENEMLAKLGWTTGTMFYVGIVECVIALAYMVPRTAFVGVILLTGYLGAAAAAHLRINEQFLFPILLGVIAWVALGLRDPRVFTMAFSSAEKAPDQPTQ